MTARKLKACINMDNDWMYHVYQNSGQGSISLGVMSLGRFFKKLKCILLNNFLCLWPYSNGTCVTLEGFEKVVHS